MTSDKNRSTAPDQGATPTVKSDEVAAIPVETLKSLAEMIARHPDEMLRVIRRYMHDDETD